jgi:hypothetical protein
MAAARVSPAMTIGDPAASQPGARRRRRTSRSKRYPATTPMGTGIQGMVDRPSALGGALEMALALGRGTGVTGRVPVLATGSAG